MERLEPTRSVGKMVIFLVPTLILLMLDAVSIAQAASTKLNKLDKKDAGGGGGRPSLTTYDQRQTGKYNIHVNIKDVKIISVDGEKFEGEFGDDTIYDYGDYDYDPAHLTVSPLPIFGGPTTSKPPKSTTKTPVSITSTRRTTTTTGAPVEDPPKKPTSNNDPIKIDASPIKDDNPSHIMSAPGATTPPSSNIYIFKPTPNYHPSPVHYDYQEIPVEVIVEPVLKPKYRNSNSRIVANRRNRNRKNPMGGAGGMDMARHGHSEIEALPSEPAVSNAEPLAATPCARGEFRDKSGKCRVRRSGIYRLLKLLAAFKEKND